MAAAGWTDTGDGSTGPQQHPRHREAVPTRHGDVRRRSWWGWGYEDEALSDDQARALGARLGPGFGLRGDVRHPPAPADLALAPPRLSPPPALAPLCRHDPEERAGHSLGKAYRDVVRALAGCIEHPTDLVARPRHEDDVVAVLDWCAGIGAAVIPYGGGSSVVGGIEPRLPDTYPGVVTLDLSALDTVREIDQRSLAARIEAGTLGPQLEEQLRPHGLTLRHFPQSFECSSLGGWVATRAGGHFATGPTHIDDLVESLRMVTPAGVIESRRLPGSGAGPSPDRLLLGSEGILGVVTEAWVRVRPRPRWRGGGPVRFADFSAGAEAVRALAQSGLQPSNCRLIDALEALVNGAGDGSAAILIVGFESADHPVGPWVARAAEIVADLGGTIDPDTWRRGDVDGSGSDGGGGDSGGGAADRWRASFMRAPYARDALARLGALCDTFETACTWDRLAELVDRVQGAVASALREVGAGTGFVTCRLTHAYPDGAAPYFTVIAPGRAGAEIEQWDTVKAAASEALMGAGGTITHHHAVGRDHRPWYDRQRPALFADALAAAKATLDPGGIMNPGVLIDPR